MEESGITQWNSPNTGATNESGFTALPGGFHEHSGTFRDLGFFGIWWSSTDDSGTTAWYRSLFYAGDTVSLGTLGKRSGLSVRCVRD